MRRAVASFGVALALAGGTSLAAPVRFDVSLSEPAKGGAAPVKVALRLEEVGAGSLAPRMIEQEVQAPASVSIELPAGAAWRLTARGEGVWSPPQHLSADQVKRGTPAAVVLFPAGIVHGRLEAVARERPPALRDLDLRLAEAPGAPGAARYPETVVRCPVADNEFRCLVPAGRLDLRLKAAGFVPIYLWGISVERGAMRDLGALALKRGSSLVGRVQAEGGANPGAACTVRLVPQHTGELPQHASAEDVAADRRLRRLARETHPNGRGFFVFEDLPPGVYGVTAVAPGLAPAGAPSIEVRGGLEAEIREPLTLSRPVTFEVVLDPPVDPYGQPWRLELAAHDATLEGAASWHKGVAALDGRWVEKGVAAGTYRLQVLGEGETRWAEEEVEVRAGQPPLFLAVPVVEVRGTVALGDEPLAATLWFGGRNGQRRIRFDSDAKGRFEGALSSEGKWPVEVIYADDATARVGLPPVEVKRPTGKRFASLALHVPNTVLHGEVVDEAGSPLPAAQVSIQQGGQTRSAATSDQDGSFTLRGLTPGPLAVEAVRGERTSGWVNAAVAEDRESPRLRLVARRQAEYRGRVVSPRGPVAGAQILAFPQLDEAAPVTVATVAEAVTDPEGAFALRLPAGARSLNLLVFPAGFALRLLSLPADPERPLAIAVDANGGNLLLPPQGGLLAHGGTFLPTDLIRLWLSPNGQPGDGKALRIPNVEPGAYTFCWAEAVAASDALRRGATPPAEHCATGTVQPFADLNLAPAAPAPQR